MRLRRGKTSGNPNSSHHGVEKEMKYESAHTAKNLMAGK
jgi:hypothetical protein